MSIKLIFLLQSHGIGYLYFKKQCELWIFFFEQRDFVLTNGIYERRKKKPAGKKYQNVTASNSMHENKTKINQHQQSIEMNNEFIWRTRKILLLRHFWTLNELIFDFCLFARGLCEIRWVYFRCSRQLLF